jgi:hypothetical protein
VWPQVRHLEERLSTEHAATPPAAAAAAAALEAELARANRLLAERQAQWEAQASERAGRVLRLERQLAEVRTSLVGYLHRGAEKWARRPRAAPRAPACRGFICKLLPCAFKLDI